MKPGFSPPYAKRHILFDHFGDRPWWVEAIEVALLTLNPFIWLALFFLAPIWVASLLLRAMLRLSVRRNPGKSDHGQEGALEGTDQA